MNFYLYPVAAGLSALTLLVLPAPVQAAPQIPGAFAGVNRVPLRVVKAGYYRQRTHRSARYRGSRRANRYRRTRPSYGYGSHARTRPSYGYGTYLRPYGYGGYSRLYGYGGYRTYSYCY